MIARAAGCSGAPPPSAAFFVARAKVKSAAGGGGAPRNAALLRGFLDWEPLGDPLVPAADQRGDIADAGLVQLDDRNRGGVLFHACAVGNRKLARGNLIDT